MLISLDTEYSELNVRKADLLSISIGFSSSVKLFKANQIREVKEITDKAEVIFVQNGVVDHHILGRNGLDLDKSKFVDCMLLEHLIDERLEHGLGPMALRYFNDDYKNEFWGAYDRFQDAPLEVADEYERKDARYTFDLGVKFLSMLKDKMELVKHVHRLQWALWDTEVKGLKVDHPLISRTKDEMSAKISGYLPELRRQFSDVCSAWELEKWREEIAKRKSEKGKSGVPRPVFSFASDKQLRWLLYDALECPVLEKTKKGAPSSDLDTILKLAAERPELATLAEYKKTKAVYATFVEGMLDRVEDGRVHPHFNVNGTATGRLSSSNPNFQNMPSEGVIRNFILPEEGRLIIGADFEGLEVGVEANLTEDPQLLRIMLENANKHDITAEAVGWPRKDAKTLNFLLQYGGGMWKIQKTFGISESEAKEAFERYWIAYSGVKRYKDLVFKMLESDNCVTNIFGRTRHFDKPRNPYEKAKQERQAYSHMVQGPGGEMNNMASYIIDDYFKQNGKGRFLFPCHDEIVAEADKDFIPEALEAIVSLMESTNSNLGFKYRIKAKGYGPFECWRKA